MGSQQGWPALAHSSPSGSPGPGQIARAGSSELAAPHAEVFIVMWVPCWGWSLGWDPAAVSWGSVQLFN